MVISKFSHEVHEYASKEAKSVLKELNSSLAGLSHQEAKQRWREFGPNVLVERKEFNAFLQFLSQFSSPFIIILIFAGIISLFVGERTDAIIIGLIILSGAILDFYQQYNADKSLKRLLETVKTTTTVIREGKKLEVDTHELVVGDILFLQSGDLIPADARVLDAKDFFVNQSAITGESFPIEKISTAVNSKKIVLTHLHNILFSGTNVVSGSATAVVVETGKRTEFGKISKSLAQAAPKSEFEVGVTHFGFFVMKLTIFLVVFIFLFGSLLKQQYLESLLFAIAIAVGITPELLPLVMSITMTIGSKIMAKKGVIVKRLSSIPNFGSMNILCTDKTGTLTENQITVVKYTNYLGKEEEKVLHLTYVNSSFQTGIKNPLDEAVMNFGKLNQKLNLSDYNKIDEIPYDFFRKRMSVVAKNKDLIMITKGAPEEIFQICSTCKIDSKKASFNSIKERALKTYHSLSSSGYRVLAVAAKNVKRKSVYSKDDENEMEFIGFISFFDPPKKDVKAVIKEMESLGVEVKVVTGDNELVTKKICQEVGLKVKGILLGYEIQAMTDNTLKRRAVNTTIFARFSPTDKSRLILVLKSANNVVGYLGDGINDALSLKSADVGISVSTAVDIAKESADLVLTKKSLYDLKEGIIEGRKTFANTMKYIMMMISSNFGNMFSAAGAILFLPFLPMLPIQILLNNLIYDFSQMTIPLDNVDPNWIQKPKRWNLKFIKHFMYVFGPISSLFDFITFGVLFLVVKVNAATFQTGWFMESLATQVLVIHIIRTKDTPFFKSTGSKILIISSVLCLIAGWILPYTLLGPIFHFEPLPWHLVLILGGIVVAYLIVVQFAKKYFYRRYDF